MYTLKVAPETALELFQTILKEDYYGICAEIELFSKKEAFGELELYEQEDLISLVGTKAAMDQLFKYYFTVEEQKKIIKA